MGTKLAQEKEKYMGLILIGRFLDGRPYEGAMNRPKLKKERNSHSKQDVFWDLILSTFMFLFKNEINGDILNY